MGRTTWIKLYIDAAEFDVGYRPRPRYNKNGPAHTRASGLIKEKLDKRKAKRDAAIAAVCAYFVEHYEHLERLDALQALCTDLDIEVGEDLLACKKILDGTYVNIFDFVKARTEGKKVYKFESLEELRRYSKSEYKLFPLERAKEDTVLRAMLVEMSDTGGIGR